MRNTINTHERHKITPRTGKRHAKTRFALSLILMLVIFIMASCGRPVKNSEQDESSDPGSGAANVQSQNEEDDQSGLFDSSGESADSSGDSGTSSSSSGNQPISNDKFSLLFQKIKSIDNCKLTMAQIQNGGEPVKQYFWFKGKKMKQSSSPDGTEYPTFQDNNKKEQYVFGYMDAPKTYQLYTEGQYPEYSLSALFPNFEDIFPMLKEAGKETVNGLDCIVGTFSQEGTDVKIWLSSEYGLPVKTESSAAGGQSTIVTYIEGFEEGTVTDSDVTLPEGAVSMDGELKQGEQAHEKELETQKEAEKTTEELLNLLNNPSQMDNYYADVSESRNNKGKVWRLGNKSRVENSSMTGYLDYDAQQAYSLVNGKFQKVDGFSFMIYYDIDLTAESKSFAQQCYYTFAKTGEADVAGNVCDVYESINQDREVCRLYVEKVHHVILKTERIEGGSTFVDFEVKEFTPGTVSDLDFK